MDTLPRFTAIQSVARLDIVSVSDQWRVPVRRCTENTLCRIGRNPGVLACGLGCTCIPDETSTFFQYGVCCRPGRIACRGDCREPCPLNTALNLTTCLCETPCPVPKVRNAETGSCECPPPWTDCNGICRNLSTSKTNCGSCGNVCNQGEDCCDGVCAPLDTCSDCGFCGNACASDEGCCNRARRKLNTTQNCGTYDSGCGVKCDTGEICQAGQCVCPSGRVKCGNTCCPTGQRCCNGACTDVKKSKQHCGACNMPVPQGWDCCDGVPVDTRSNKQHCGACNKPISATQIAMGFECCNGVPVNTQGNNVLNCGGCGQTCTGGTSCVGTVCTNYAAACQAGQCVCPSGRYACRTFCAENAYPVCCGFPRPQNGRDWACPAGRTCSPMGTCV